MAGCAPAAVHPLQRCNLSSSAFPFVQAAAASASPRDTVFSRRSKDKEHLLKALITSVPDFSHRRSRSAKFQEETVISADTNNSG